jgi:zinc D-Ala-D-Ala carboxypeptidase
MTWENFDYVEFACSHCGENEMSEFVIDHLQKLRNECDFPFIITSGYRCPEHPIEAAKSAPGPHSTGLAVDIGVSHKEALSVLFAAVLTNAEAEMSIWQGFGINQKGGSRFIHLDQCDENERRPRPHIWSY